MNLIFSYDRIMRAAIHYTFNFVVVVAVVVIF